MVKPFLIGIMAVVAGLSACSDSPTLYRPVAFGSGPIQAAWNYGFAGKMALVEVHNPPAGTSAADLAARVTVPLGAAPVAGFTSDSAQATDARYRIVLVFGPAPSFDGNAACALASAPVASDANSGEVQAALCQKDERLSEIRLRSAGSDPFLGSGSAQTDIKTLRLVLDQLYSPRVGGGQDRGACLRIGGC